MTISIYVSFVVIEGMASKFNGATISWDGDLTADSIAVVRKELANSMDVPSENLVIVAITRLDPKL